MKTYLVKVECTYEFEIEIGNVKSKAEAIQTATTELLEHMSIEDMTLKKAKAKVLDVLLND